MRKLYTIGARITNAKGIVLPAINKPPPVISMTAMVGNRYPVFPMDIINATAPSAISGIYMYWKNLFNPKLTNNRPIRILNTISIFRFIFNPFYLPSPNRLHNSDRDICSCLVRTEKRSVRFAKIFGNTSSIFSVPFDVSSILKYRRSFSSRTRMT